MRRKASRVPAGKTFEVWDPAASPIPADALDARRGERQAGGGRALLLVEDRGDLMVGDGEPLLGESLLVRSPGLADRFTRSAHAAMVMASRNAPVTAFSRLALGRSTS